MHQLVGDVLAAIAQGLPGHVGVSVPGPAGRVRVGRPGGRMLHPRGGHNAHGLACSVGEGLQGVHPALHGTGWPCQALSQGFLLPRTRQPGPVQDGVHLVAEGAAAFSIDGCPAQPQSFGVGFHPTEVSGARASAVGHLPVDGVGLEARWGQWGFKQGQQERPPSTAPLTLARAMWGKVSMAKTLSSPEPPASCPL